MAPLMAPADGLSSTINAKRAPDGVPVDIVLSEMANVPGHWSKLLRPGTSRRTAPSWVGGDGGRRTATGDMMEMAIQQKAKSALAPPRNSYMNVTRRKSL